MKRNSILVLGLGVFLSVGLLASGCSDSGGGTAKLDGSSDAKKDTGSTGGALGTGGKTGTGGIIGTAGATGAGGGSGTAGATGAGGATGTAGVTGTAGATGAGGSSGGTGGAIVVDAGKIDGSGDTTKVDSSPVDVSSLDSNRDVSIIDGSMVQLDSGSVDAGVDAPLTTDLALPLDAAALDTVAVDGGIDGGVDGNID